MGLVEGSLAVIRRSQTERPWPWSPASPSTFSEKTRIMSLESVSTAHPLPAPTQSLFSALSLPSPPVTGKVLWTLGWACVYFPSTERSPQPMPLLLEVGRTPGAQGRWYLMRGEELWGLGTGTPMLEDVDEGGIRPWHLVKPSEEPEPPRPRRGSLRGGERERAKAIPEIYLTRLLSMKVGQEGRGGRLGSGPGPASGLGCRGGRMLRGFGVVWGLHEHGATGRPRPG